MINREEIRTIIENSQLASYAQNKKWTEELIQELIGKLSKPKIDKVKLSKLIFNEIYFDENYVHGGDTNKPCPCLVCEFEDIADLVIAAFEKGELTHEE